MPATVNSSGARGVALYQRHLISFSTLVASMHLSTMASSSALRASRTGFSAGVASVGDVAASDIDTAAAADAAAARPRSMRRRFRVAGAVSISVISW